MPLGISISPTMDLNERNSIVMAHPNFGNRIHPAKANAIFPVEVHIVDDGTPLMLLGPKGPVSAVGLKKMTTRHPYFVDPMIMKAKISMMDDVAIGDGPPPPSRKFVLLLFA